MHNRFDEETVDNDIALLKLPRAVTFPYACLPTAPPKEGEKCTVMGWGKRRPQDIRGSKRLREAVVSKTLFFLIKRDLIFILVEIKFLTFP